MTNPLFGGSFTHRRSSGFVMQEGIADFLKIIASGEEYVQHFANVATRECRRQADVRRYNYPSILRLKIKGSRKFANLWEEEGGLRVLIACDFCLASPS